MTDRRVRREIPIRRAAFDGASEVVPDVIQNEKALQDAAVETAPNFDPSPAITRLEVVTPAKLLVIDDDEPALCGYRCFLAITDKSR